MIARVDSRASSGPALVARVRGDLLAFALPALTLWSFPFGGRLYLAEVAALLLLPMYVFSREARRLRDPIARRVFQLLGIWFVGQAITDVIRATAPTLLVRGWSLIIVTAVNFAVLWMIIQTRRQILLACAGFALGSLAGHLLMPSEFGLSDPWKFGYGFPITLAGVALLSALRVPMLGCVAVLTVLAGANALQGFRSLASICLASAILLMVHRSNTHRIGISAARATAIVIALPILAFGLTMSYSFAAQSGMLGSEAALKYREQNGALGPLVGGRREVVFAAVAIGNSPIIGHGSWAQRTYDLDRQAISFLNRNGYSYYQSPIQGVEANAIPAHSHIFGAWVNAGIVALPFWLWAVALALRGVSATFPSASVAALASFVSFNLLWDIFFSPFGATRRLTVPLFLIALVILTKRENPVTSKRTDTWPTLA